MKKFLAVVLLVAMCSSFMAISASASGNGFNIGDFNPDGYGEAPEAEVKPSEQGTPDVIIGQNADVNIFDEPENGTAAADGKANIEKNDTKDNKLKETTVALIGKKQYDSIEDAIKASIAGDVIKLTKNIEASSIWLKTSFLTLDLGGHTITFNVGKGEQKKDGSFPGHPYCFWIQKDTEIKNGTIKIVPADKDAFMFQNPIMVTDKAQLNFNAKLEYDKTKFGGNQFDAFGGDGTVNDGSEEEEADFPLMVNDVKFSKFSEAINAAKDGDTVKLLRNAGGNDFEINKNLTFELGGFTVKSQTITVAEGANVTFVNGTVKDIVSNGTLTLSDNVNAGDITVNEKGMLNINSASVSANSVKAPGAMNITAGAFNSDPSAFLGANYTATEKDGMWVVSERANAAEVNGNGYKTVAAAVEAAKDGETVALKADVNESITVSGKNIVLDLGGKTLNGNITVEEGAGLTVQNGNVGDINVNGALTISDKNVTAGKVVAGEKAKVNITAGTFKTDSVPVNPEYKLVANADGTFTVTIKATLTPDNAKHIKGTSAGLKVKASEAIVKVQCSGKPDAIEPQFYDLSEDKMTLTFHADWLNQLTVGEYEIVFTLENNTKSFKLTVDTDTVVKLDPASITYVKGEAKDTVFTTNEPITGKVIFNNEEVSDKSFTLDENKTTLTLKADFLNNQTPGSYELKVATDYGEAVAGVTVKAAVMVDPASQQFEHLSTKDVTFTVTSTEEITSVSENGIELTKGTDYTINGKKLVFFAAYLNKLSTGSHEFTVNTANGSAKLTIEVVYSKTSVTDASGKEISELKYFKGNSSMNNEFKFKVSPKLVSLSVDGKELVEGTDYEVLSNGVLRIAKDADFLKNMAAGQHALSFKLANDAAVDVKLLVYPSVKFSNTTYNKGSKKDIEITVSDMADTILYGSELKPIEDKYWTYDSVNGKYIIDSSFFEAQPEGDLALGLRYGEMSFTLNGFKVNGVSTIKPYNYVDKEGKSVWPYGSDTLGFKVEPDVKGVTIDGVKLTDKQYSIDKNGILWISASKLQKLDYGKHSIVVETSYGEAEMDFYTKVGIEPKNEDYHVKGGKKNLSFVSSEPIKEVYVGKEKLKDSYYTLSKDRMTLTLKADFMNRLKADVTYGLTVTTEAGKAACNFRILSPGSAAATPKTGDESSFMIWAAVLVLSGAAVVALIPKKKKN